MSKNRKQPLTQPRKRRWLNIGPGILLALAASALIGSQWIKREAQTHQQPSAPPIVESTIICSAQDSAGPTPEVSFIISRADKLKLTQDQVTRLKTLQDEWQRVYVPKLAEANKAADETGKYLTDAKGNKQTPMAQIKDAAAPVVALSAEISAARRDFWTRASSILTPEQRTAIQKEREADWAAKTKSQAKQ